MITKLLSLVRKHAFFIFISYLLLILVLSFITIQEVEVVDETFDDKIFHCIAYFVMVVFAFNYTVKTSVKYAPLLCSLFCFSYGTIIEILQPRLSEYRAFDYYDIVANTLGIVFAVLAIIAFKNKVKIK
ncbi:VanZ family protein [Ichthyenterobacterium sp. W332]|uniref:VanZ family protein n=1 Tax=Microcosmobacter mediterraneus TaxID=3075607 RepID=A0ABU2YHS1_9FLAO|nr:VanZ family protein [Ichthyenterobacterium sp. W332]MDT0557720.1 VanZ family protein [Ichthyenterobacterium sp. W332]